MLVMAALWLRPAPNSVEREVVDSHVRSLMAGHLTDVLSTDQRTVKPWFAGKLDFSPPVRDFAAEGFPLVGGRLDYIDNHAAAAIVYRRNQHLINALVWPLRAPDKGFRNSVEQGYHVIETVHGAMEIWIVSDLNADELTQFARTPVLSLAGFPTLGALRLCAASSPSDTIYHGGAVFSTVIDHSDDWIYVSAEQSSATASVSANSFHTLKVASDGTLSEPFPPTVLPVTSTPPVRVQGITVFLFPLPSGLRGADPTFLDVTYRASRKITCASLS
jgi:hypothetical protein